MRTHVSIHMRSVGISCKCLVIHDELWMSAFLTFSVKFCSIHIHTLSILIIIFLFISLLVFIHLPLYSIKEYLFLDSCFSWPLQGPINTSTGESNTIFISMNSITMATTNMADRLHPLHSVSFPFNRGNRAVPYTHKIPVCRYCIVWLHVKASQQLVGWCQH